MKTGTHPADAIRAVLRRHDMTPEAGITVLRLIYERRPDLASLILRRHGYGPRESEAAVADIVRIQVQSGTTGWE
jgi:hypothetical protein